MVKNGDTLGNPWRPFGLRHYSRLPARPLAWAAAAGKLHRPGGTAERQRPRPREGPPMPRLPRRWQWTEAACYHLMDRGHNRESVFADDEDRARFLARLARYRDRFGLRLYHYGLMGNHFHLVAQLPEPRRLSALMAGLLR